MGLSPAKGGLEFDHRVSSGSRQSLQGGDQKLVQPGGDVGAAKELPWVTVLGRSLPPLYLGQIRGELGGLVASLPYVLVGGDHLAPGRKTFPGLTTERSFHRLLAHLLGLPLGLLAADLQLMFLYLNGFFRGDRGEKTLHGVQSTVGVIQGEALLVGPLVPYIHELGDNAALRAAEDLAEDLVPFVPHNLEQVVHIAEGVLAHGLGVDPETAGYGVRSPVAVSGLQPLQYEGP